MKRNELIKANGLDSEIKNRDNLSTHFKQRIENPIEEINNLLHGYNNLMSGFNRVEIAEFMISAFSKYNEEKLKQLESELEVL